MDIVKPSILPGFMELLPADQLLFNRMLDTIRLNYEKFGFLPIDTPIIEKSEILLAKGGGETEKQIYRFNKGDTDLSMRFDLTVPLARYVALHSSDLTFPFRRYQLGKVFRGERNQKGRFREFYQCDIDIIGNGQLSILNDAEIPGVIYSTFKDLGFESFTIRINNRKVLNGFFSALALPNKADVLRIIDKLDKIGPEAVIKELRELGIEESAIVRLMTFIQLKGSNEEVLTKLKAMGLDDPEFNLGLEELTQVIQHVGLLNVPEENYQIDLTIARGLDYYTGTIYETILNDYPSIGSVCSGGRYDNLAGYYTKQQLPGVGISIGLTRLFYQLKEANFFKVENPAPSQVLIVPLGDTVSYALNVAQKLRTQGVSLQIYYEDGKIAKKLGYADKLSIPWVALLGENEVAENMVTLKNLQTGEQKSLRLDEAVRLIQTT
ncbi:histidine--tRNA ligase [Desulfosporosinus sp. BG]|uniref:histidine--tRNA ligase n=1 Tax=Desulfosporosinus sp. BG TaxID=1633135 RepID=UPI00083A0213|nr:histidine--tRNA ligase [Desulfosporosinus sp. BG]ODA40450.1 Histidyl-tRNA synthetase [Desulfosporosinus sp. BG]